MPAFFRLLLLTLPWVCIFCTAPSRHISGHDTPTNLLLSLPYAQYVTTDPAPRKPGVTIHAKDKAFPGYNLFTSNNNLDVFVKLVDMEGALLHQWDRSPQDRSTRWQHVWPFPDGSLLLTSQWTPLDWQKIDAASRSLAVYNIPHQRAHHATCWLPEDGFLGLLQNTVDIPFQNLTITAEDNSIVQVSPKGHPLKTIPLSRLFAKDPHYQKNLRTAYEDLKKFPPSSCPRKQKKKSFDLLHANHIENLAWDIPGIASRGAWLVTIRNIDRIAIIDPKTERILWQWGDGILSAPHHATFLNQDQIMLFDNGVQKKSSRVLVLDIRTKRITWQYGQRPGQAFFTATGGAAQRLPNGNTLITDSENGRAFEVTSSGDIVWEWYADLYTEGKMKGKRRTIYRMQRVAKDFFTDVAFNRGEVPVQNTPAPDPDKAEALLSLPYVQYVTNENAPHKTGTTLYNSKKAFHGYSLYTSHRDPNVFVHLIDMNGSVVHRWTEKSTRPGAKWYHAIPFPDGSIFLTKELSSLGWQWINKNSTTRNAYYVPGQLAHHASYVLDEGGFLGLVEKKISVPVKDRQITIRDNAVIHVSEKGQVLKTIALSKILDQDPGYQKQLQKAYAYLHKNRPTPGAKALAFDPFHANHIDRLAWDIPGIAKKGDWLVTIRKLDRIMIIDPVEERIVWQWGEGIISRPHHATFLKNDTILLLDNGVEKQSSRAIIVNMRSGKITWQYGQKPGQEFFTPSRGSAQRLPNGNTLITESDKGRVFEVTSSGEIVWEWYADFYTEGPYAGKRRVVYRMERIPYDFFKDITFNHGAVKP